MAARPVQTDSADIFDPVLLHTGAEGELMWTTAYEVPGSQLIRRIMRDLSGGSWVVVDDSPEGSQFHRGMLIHVDEYDQPIGSWAVVTPPDLAVTFDGIHRLTNGDLFVHGLIEEVDVGYDGLLARITASGETVWAERITGSGLLLLSSTLMSDDRIALVGKGFNGTNEHGVALAAFSSDGELFSTGHYSGDGYGNASAVQYDPWQGLLISGTMTINDTMRGVTIRADEQGFASQMWAYDHEIQNGYSLADGSMVLFVKVPGGEMKMQRVTADGQVPWVAGLGTAIGIPTLHAYAENSMYAYFTGDFDQRVSVSTFTSNCFTCNGQPAEASWPIVTSVATDELVIDTEPFALQMIPVEVTATAMTASAMSSCMLLLAQPERDLPVVACAWNGLSRELVVTGLSVLPLSGHILLDASGRTVGSLDVRAGTVDGTSNFMPIPVELDAGVYVAHVLSDRGGASCKFVVIEP